MIILRPRVLNYMIAVSIGHIETAILCVSLSVARHDFVVSTG